MNKFLLWWVSLKLARGDAAYWQHEAEKWQRKYAAAIQVRDSLSKQLEETQAALIKTVQGEKAHKAKCALCDKEAIITVVHIPVCREHELEYTTEALQDLPYQEREFLHRLEDAAGR